MHSSDDKALAVLGFGAAWGKTPLSGDTADRIRQQTHENQLALLRNQNAGLTTELEAEKKRREASDAALDDALLLVDLLLERLAPYAAQLPERVVDVIARRQEQRIVAVTEGQPSVNPDTGMVHLSPPEGAPVLPAGGALRRSRHGSLEWTPATVLTQMLAELTKVE